jgi:hypothetical protein
VELGEISPRGSPRLAGELEVDVEAHAGGGEPRDVLIMPSDAFITVEGAAAELTRRGAWARCI